MRIDKFLSQMQIASRKESKQLLKSNRVMVNQTVIKDAKYQVDENTIVFVDNQPISYVNKYYYLLNKPQNVISATQDAKQKTVLDLFKASDYRSDLFPVGRLDKDTTGFLLITNDGELAHQLLSPKKHIPKIYQALVTGKVTAEDAQLFLKGITLKDFTAQPATLKVLDYDQAQNTSKIEVTIQEGKFHQVKRMFHAVNKEVLTLHRIKMGDLALPEDIMIGQYRPLSEAELQVLKTAK